jgi:ABC-type transport system involved in cytochrome c biogenesis permease component
MKWHKVYALFLHDLIIYRRVAGRLAEFFYFPVTNILIFGLLARQLEGRDAAAGLLVLLVQVLWNFAYLAQSTVNMQTMEDIWSGSLRQVLLTGITEWELMAARCASSTLSSLLVLGVMVLLCRVFVEDSVLLANAWPVAGLSVLTLMSALGLAVWVGGCIVMLGRSYGFLSWTIIQGFILFSLPFVPPGGPPTWLTAISIPMPFSAVFQACRDLSAPGGRVETTTWAWAILTALAYPALGLPFYGWAFARGRRNGVLAGLG